MMKTFPNHKAYPGVESNRHGDPSTPRLVVVVKVTVCSTNQKPWTEHSQDQLPQTFRREDVKDIRVEGRTIRVQVPCFLLDCSPQGNAEEIQQHRVR